METKIARFLSGLLAALALDALPAAADELQRCDLQLSPSGTLTCWLPATNTTLSCEGTVRNPVPRCEGPDGRATRCELHGTGYDAELHCSVPMPVPIGSATLPPPPPPRVARDPQPAAARPGRPALEVRIGGAAIVLPEPAELVALRNTESPYYKFTAGLQTHGGNRLLAAYLPQALARAADRGMGGETHDWASAYALGAMEAQLLSRRDFQRKIAPVIESAMDRANVRGIEGLFRDFGVEGTAQMRLDEVTPMGVLDKADNYITFGAGTRVTFKRPDGASEEMPVVAALAIITVKSKVFGLAVYRKRVDPRDAEVVRKRALEWAEVVTAANP
jgi:hypothetical protein